MSHGCAWVIGALLDVVINAVLLTEHELIPLPRPLIETLFGLGMGRVAVLVLMVALLVRRQYLLRPERGSVAEGRSLLENGDGAANGYGGANGVHAVKKRPETQTAGWFDYFAGFKGLFPYLWWVIPLHSQPVMGC